MRAIFSDKVTGPAAKVTAVVYFVQGALGIASIALPLYWRQLGWSIAAITTASSIIAIPWVLKIVYGFISDRFPLWGTRRKSYLILCTGLSSLGWGLFALLPGGQNLMIASLLMANLGFAATDVITDGLVVDHSTPETASAFQSIAWGFRSIGAFLSGVTGGYLAANFPYAFVFLITAALPLIALGMIIPLREQKAERGASVSFWLPVKKCVELLFGFPTRWFLGILLLVPISSLISIPFFFHMKEKLGFDETILGSLTSIAWLGAMLGSFIYGRFLKHVPIAPIFCAAIILNSLNILSAIWIQEIYSAVILIFAGGVLAYLTLLPLMSAAALLAHKTGVEGTFFAILMSCYNLGQIGFQFIGGRIYGFFSLKQLIWGTAALSLMGLLFVPKIASGMRLNTNCGESYEV